MVRGEGISFRVGKQVLLRPTDVGFAKGKFHVIMGANGAGKSTLLKLLSGDQEPSAGNVFLAEKNLSSYSKTELAVKRAVLSQHYHLAFPITVNEVVLMGRYPFYGINPSANDIAICRKAMAMMEVEKFSERDYTTLSGGEAQKVQMSRVLSQIWNEEGSDNKLLFLDEPVSHLDVKYQYQLMRIAKAFCGQQTTVIAVLHDINLAIAFADRILFMKEGEIRHVLDDVALVTPAIIDEIFGVSSAIIHDERHARPIVVF
ncbi:heme ABC transporter ATP-binding protein [Flavisolibacter nicotianae]|uniref:heme ABC transporter ATP-binding protein n=1 Tax=Flavisolibacter nicotianae TaxID=2364882 RepID=UPI000EB0C021|nr:heme ABC transporter ATP-binding protein [Flavisolibacter nicotianae]